MKKTFFLLGGSIVDTFDTEGFSEVLKEVKKGKDFQIASFDPKKDYVANFLGEVLGQDNFAELTKEQHDELLKHVK